jgi:hypothetical protein
MARADLGRHYRQSVLSQFDFPLYLLYLLF